MTTWHSLNQHHPQAALPMVRSYKRFIDGICAAIRDAIDTWMHSASIVTVTLTGTTGTVLPAATIGPKLKPLILATAPQATDQEKKYSAAIATAVSDNWELWQTGLSGILTYPPFGPPGPNIPTPLLTFTSAGEANLAPENLTADIAKSLDGDGALRAMDLFHSVAQAFYAHFQIFKTNTMITGVIMTPPVTPPPEETEGAAESAEDKIEAPKPELLPGGMVIPTPGNFV